MTDFIQHKDKIGQDIANDSIVIIPVSKTTVEVCSIVKSTNKMIRCQHVGKPRNKWNQSLRYPNQVVVINDIPESTFYLLTV